VFAFVALGRVASVTRLAHSASPIPPLPPHDIVVIIFPVSVLVVLDRVAIVRTFAHSARLSARHCRHSSCPVSGLVVVGKVARIMRLAHSASAPSTKLLFVA
jgi:hypothetical protein